MLWSKNSKIPFCENEFSIWINHMTHYGVNLDQYDSKSIKSLENNDIPCRFSGEIFFRIWDARHLVRGTRLLEGSLYWCGCTTVPCVSVQNYPKYFDVNALQSHVLVFRTNPKYIDVDALQSHVLVFRTIPKYIDVNALQSRVLVFRTIPKYIDVDALQSHVLVFRSIPRWCHQMKTFSVLLALCAGNSPVTGDFPSQRPVTLSSDISFDLYLNKR